MSGILGVWNSRKPTPWQKMLDDLTVLGPDGKGDWFDATLALSLGRTQFFNTPESCLEAPVVECDGCVLVWDGRLDDRSGLLAGRSNISDAQLIIEAYRRWGVDCLSYLTGEFAFILWDSVQDLVFAGCDVVAGRTLAYFWDGQTLLLSSRVITLLLHPQVSCDWNEIYVAHTVCHLNAHPPGITAFKDIHRLLPGEAILLKAGNLQKRQIAELKLPERYVSPESPELYYEEFWDLMNRAVRDRLRTHRQAGTTLSGGLDSTTVTVALLNHLPSVKAFSNITTVFPAFDERQPIQSFLSHYPQIQWQGVNADQAWAFSESWDDLPIPDDPFIAGTIPMDLQLMTQIRQSGCNIIFDGAWGDHLFFAGWHDIAKAGNWFLIWKHLQQSKSPRSAFWHEFVLPFMPQVVQKQWFQYVERKRTVVPHWIKPEFVNQRATQVVIQQHYQARLIESLPRFVLSEMRSTRGFGSLQVYRLLKSFHGLEATSPFQDQRLVEFAFKLHPVLQHDWTYNKIFLRYAVRDQLPSDVQWRPKVNFFDPLVHTGLAKSEKAFYLLDLLSNDAFFSSFSNIELMKSFLTRFRQDYFQGKEVINYYSPRTIDAFYKILVFYNWIHHIFKFRAKNCEVSSMQVF